MWQYYYGILQSQEHCSLGRSVESCRWHQYIMAILHHSSMHWFIWQLCPSLLSRVLLWQLSTVFYVTAIYTVLYVTSLYRVLCDSSALCSMWQLCMQCAMWQLCIQWSMWQLSIQCLLYVTAVYTVPALSVSCAYSALNFRNVQILLPTVHHLAMIVRPLSSLFPIQRIVQAVVLVETITQSLQCVPR